MSDLQISLLIIGAVVVAGVYAFNHLQERQFRRRVEEAFARQHDDVLLKETAAPKDTPERVEPKRVEPTLQPEDSPAAARRTVAKAPATAAIDPLIDYVVEVDLASPASADELRQELQALATGWGKPVLAAGYDAGSDTWETATTGAGYEKLRFGVQMSNRSGCVRQNQLAAFRDAVLKWAARNGGAAKCLDAGEGYAMAAQLDRFCADVDIAVGINVVTPDANPFSGTKIRGLAEAAGLKLEPDGIFYARDDKGVTRFTLDNHEPMPFVPEQLKAISTRGVTFLLDVPRVEDPLRAFDEMLEMSTSFATALGATLVDDNRAALSDEAIARIRRQLETIVAKMEAGQIAAGGTRALRLFS